MPTASGPNTLGESNLIFAYDTGDVKNSYKGQPTVNAFGTYPNYPTDLYNWAYSGNACTLTQDTISSPVGNTPLKMVTTGNDAYTGTYGSSGWNISAASSGQTWTISVWAKANQNTTGQIFHFGANSSGDIIDFSATTISLTTEWTRYTYTRTFTDGNVVAIQARLDGPNTFQSGVVVWWDGLQVEQKAYATQFVDGTRSVTQGLLPLAGNSTIDLTNVSFDSNAQVLWDGTDDTLAISDTVTHKPNTSFTYEIVFKPLGGGTFYDKMLIGKVGWNTGIMYQYSTIWFRTRYGSPAFYDTSGYSVTQGNYYHAVATYTSNTSMKFYVNGTLIGENNSVTTPLFDIGDTLNIGGSSVNYSSYVEIPVVRNYNKALSAQEVKQNYQQYLTRFNLS